MINMNNQETGSSIHSRNRWDVIENAKALMCTGSQGCHPTTKLYVVGNNIG